MKQSAQNQIAALRHELLGLAGALFGSLASVAEGIGRFFRKVERSYFDLRYPPGDIRRMTVQIEELSRKLGEAFAPAVIQLGKAFEQFAEAYKGAEEGVPVQWATSETADPIGDFFRTGRLDTHNVTADHIFIDHSEGGKFKADWTCPVCGDSNRADYNIEGPNLCQCKSCRRLASVRPGADH